MDLGVELAPRHERGLRLRNPVMTAAGTFGYGTEHAELLDIQRLGAIVCKGTTIEPRDGNPQPRLVETAAGLLNSVGLQNIGIRALIEEKAPVWAKWQVPVVVNIAGDNAHQYAEVASMLEGVAGVSAIEVNISCPNVERGEMEFGADPQAAAQITAAVKAASSLPILVKLSPNVSDIAHIARAVAQAGADAVSLINTLRGMAIDKERRRPILGNIAGGLSGPAIKPIALYAVYRVAQAVPIPVIGCGGIVSASDALEFIMAGASAVQVGTASFADPHAPLEVVEGIERFMEGEGIERLTDLIGVAQR